MCVKKRVLSLLLAVCMTLSLLPATAYAAVGGLLGNPPERNESLLQQLEQFTGESYEEVYDLLDTLGLLDEDGNLVTDRTIDLDGETYTLEEMEALLSDPATDLTQVAEVDGVPIALKDLKTIIAIERQLQYLQEKYFTGATFEGETLENLNSLLEQLQGEGMTLTANREQVVFDTSNVQVKDDTYYISTPDVTIPQGTTLSIKFKVDFSNVLKAMGFWGEESVSNMFNRGLAVYLSDQTSNRYSLGNNSGEIIYFFTPEEMLQVDGTEYTLTTDAFRNDYTGPLYLCISAPGISDYATTWKNYLSFGEISFGDIWQNVSFYDAQGFFFQDGSGLSDCWNGYFSISNPLPAMPGSASASQEMTSSNKIDYELVSQIGFSLALSTDLEALEQTLTYLQQCLDTLDSDSAIRTHVTATIKQENTDDYQNITGEQHRTLIVPLSVLLGANPYIDANSVTGFPLSLPSGRGTADISYNIISTTMSSYPAVYPLNFLLKLIICKDDTVQWDQISDGDFDETYVYYVNGYTATTTKSSFELVNDGEAPILTVSAPQGTYRSGDVIPITITADEFIQATNDTQITINNTPYTLEELHGSTSGKYITFFYEVKEMDDGVLTVGVASNSGITDYWGNEAKEVNNVTVSGVTLDTPILKNAVENLDVTYDESGKALNFAISAKQGEYQQMYSEYLTDPTGLMRLLVSVNGAPDQEHTVTMEEGANDSYTFTAKPYPLTPTTVEQNVTVQLQVKNGESWETVPWETKSVTIARRVDVADVVISVVGAGPDYNYTIALSDEAIPKLQAQTSPEGAATSGTWHSTDETVATITKEGQIELQSKTGKVSFYYVADNGTPEDTKDDKESNHLEFTITAGDKLYLGIPQYAQESLLQSGSSATVKWNTNVFDLYPGQDITFTVKLFAGTEATGEPSKSYEVKSTAGGERITSCTIPATDLPVTYPQSQYTVEVGMESPEKRAATSSITVLSPPTQLRITSDKTDLTDEETAALTCTISGNPDAKGTLSAARMADGASTAEEVTSQCLSATSVDGGSGTVRFTPAAVGSGLYDTYTITFTENETGSPNFAPSSDSIVLRVYRSGALEIQPEGPITMDNTSKVSGSLPTDSKRILELRQELGLIEYVSINADAYNWSSFRDGIRWVSDHPEAVGIYYRQGGLWDNIADLSYETYLPRTQMALSATTDGSATITATHAATGMSDSVTVNVNTLRDKFYLFQVTPAVTTEVTYTNGAGESKTVQTNADGLLALYEPSGIQSDVYFRSGSEKEPNLGTILNSALSSGERDAAKLQLYPLNTVTLRPAAKAELYLVQPDGTPFANETVTLRGGVYLGGYYCESAQMGPTSNSLISGATDGKYTTDQDGKLTVYMDATQFAADGYTGQLTNAALDYWFELSDMDNNKYYPTLVNIQGSMSADRILRTGSAVVTLEEVPQGQEEQPFLTAQTMAYGKESGTDLQIRDVMGSTGRVGPNSTYKYAELTSRFMLWGVEAENGKATVSMTGENGFVPEGQTVEDSTFPFSSIPIVTNTMVLTKKTMTESGWLKPETAAKLRACVYQNDQLLKDVSMPFQVIDLTDVKLVNEDAKAVVLDMQGSFQNGLNSNSSRFTFGGSSISSAFNGDIASMLRSVANSSNPLFKVLITPTEDSTVFNVLIWGGYDSLELEDFDYDQDGLSMNYELLDTERQVGVPSVGDLSDMAQGNYHPRQDLRQNYLKTTNSGLDFGAQLTGCYEGQFYYDTDQHAWAFRVVSGGFTAGAGVGFEANVNFFAGPIPITASFGAGLSLQLDYKAATVYTDQVKDTSGWSEEAKASDSVNDFLTTLRINGYISAFGGVGFDYSIVALKIGLFGKLTGDSTNQFLSRTYLTSGQQRNGQALGVEGEVGLKVVVKLLFISYDGALVSGKVNYNEKFGDYQYINDYWTGNGTSTTSLAGTPTLLSRSYLEAYANGERAWNTPGFDSDATVVQSDANPGSEPVVNDDGSLSAYISDGNSEDFYASRIRAGKVGDEGAVIDDDGDDTNNGFGDLSPSLSGTSGFTVAAWSRLSTNLDKNAGDPISPDEQKQLLNSTEIMVAATSDGGSSWTTKQLTDNASPDLAPVTAVGGSHAVVFWRSVYASDANDLTSFDTRDSICFSIYDGNGWSDAKMAYNGSQGGVVGLKTAMLENGTSIVVFTLDRGSSDPENQPMEGYELAYRVVEKDGTLGDLVVLTNDKETDANPQVAAADGSFILGWYSTQDGGDIRLQAVGADGQLYNGSSENAIPASVKAISQEENLNINSNFQFAKESGQSVHGLTLVWAETASNAKGEADHSVLYGTQLCKSGGEVYLSTPRPLVTLPSRTLSNSFSAWKDSDGKISAYIFGTQYSESATENVAGYAVPADTDQLLTGGGSLTAEAVSVDAISVDYANLQVNAFTPVGFTLRNTGTTPLTGLKAEVGGYASDAVALNPGESASVTVLYKTGAAIANTTYTITADGSGPLAGDTLHLDYNDVGISSMEVVREHEGKRTVQVTLYNDSAALLENTGRTVELSLYTDSEYTSAAAVTLEGSQDGVSVSGNTVTLRGDALRRMDQGSMTFQFTYDLKDYVCNTLQQEEVPASGVYLYAKAEVKENSQTMAEYATGNNTSAVLLTGAYARTGEKTTRNVTQTNTDVTTAVVELKNNSLQDQTTATLVASLLDEDGQVLETKTTDIRGTLLGETVQTSTIPFTRLGSRVVVHAAAAGEDSLTFEGLPVTRDDFKPDENGVLTYAISGISDYGTLVTAISGSGEKVTINGTEFTGSGSQYIPIGAGETVITVHIGSTAYALHITSTHTSGGGGGGNPSYKITVESGDHGTVTASRSMATAGTAITLTPAPEEGYRLASLTATDPTGKTIPLNGKGDGTYTFTMPAGAVTVKASFAEMTSDGLPFVDVPAGSWYEEGVRYVYEHGLMAGTSATTFSPEVTTSRSMIAAILWRVEGSPVVNYAMTFDDVDQGSWYGEAVRWAASEGIVAGYGDNKFGPDDPITREQMAAMLYRYAQYKGYDVSVGESTNLLSYADVAELGEYAVPAMQWAVGSGIINGTGKAMLSPRGSATRAQVAVMLKQFCEKYVTW